MAEAVISIQPVPLLAPQESYASEIKKNYNKSNYKQSGFVDRSVSIAEERLRNGECGAGTYIGELIDSFKIDKKSDIPVWVQLRQRLVYLISSGFYKTGDQLPTVRELAVQLDINYHTVNKVYHDLEEDGYVEKMVGRGTFVTDLSEIKGQSPKNEVDLITTEFIDRLTSMGMTAEDIIEVVKKNLKRYS